MSSAAQSKAFDLSGFLGNMFGGGQDTPEASNEFGVGNINNILDTQLKTQALAGQQASNQAYNNTVAANNLGRQNAQFSSGLKAQKLQTQNAIAKGNQTTRSGGSFSTQVPLFEDVGFQRDNALFNRNTQAVRDAVRQTAAIEASQRQRDIANQKAINNQQNQQAMRTLGSQLASNKEIARIDAQARLASAQLGMQGQILGGLFSSVGSGSPNYRYW